MKIHEILDLEMEYIAKVNNKIINITNNLMTFNNEDFKKNITLLTTLINQKEEILKESKETVELLFKSFDSEIFIKEKENIENAIKELEMI